MVRARDLLARFRPLGTPGPAAPPGVPVDRVAELAAELRPVFDALAGVEAECAARRAEARRTAEEGRARAAEQARALVESAQRDADVVRAEAAARGRALAAREWAATEATAEREAARIRDDADARVGPLVERVVTAVRSDEGRAP